MSELLWIVDVHIEGQNLFEKLKQNGSFQRLIEFESQVFSDKLNLKDKISGKSKFKRY